MPNHSVVDHDRWVMARRDLLSSERQLTHLREEVASQRRELPWEPVTKEYRFDGPDGPETFADLFGRHSQLVVYHFMFAPGATEGCPHCSFWADNFDGAPVHLAARDVSFVVVSRAPFSAIVPYKERMGWRFKWVSSEQNDFNYDFGVSFTPEDLAAHTAEYNYGRVPGGEDREGISVFTRDRSGALFHAYSTYARGIDWVNGTYQLLDLVPKGRDEPSSGNPQFWVRRHDEYRN